jgi:hypothetical protein
VLQVEQKPLLEGLRSMFHLKRPSSTPCVRPQDGPEQLGHLLRPQPQESGLPLTSSPSIVPISNTALTVINLEIVLLKKFKTPSDTSNTSQCMS